VLFNECDPPAPQAGSRFNDLSPSPEPLSHRVDDWMHRCIQAWETHAWSRSDWLDRLAVMRFERMCCAGIMQRLLHY